MDSGGSGTFGGQFNTYTFNTRCLHQEKQTVNDQRRVGNTKDRKGGGIERGFARSHIDPHRRRQRRGKESACGRAGVGRGR